MLTVVAMDDDREEVDGAVVLATSVAALVGLVSAPRPESGSKLGSWVNGGPCRNGASEEVCADVGFNSTEESSGRSNGPGDGEVGVRGCRSCCTILVNDGC